MFLPLLGGILALVLMLAILLFEFKRRSTSMFLWVSIIAFFGISHLGACINLSYENRILNEVTAFSVLFCIFYILVRFICSRIKGLHINISYNEFSNGFSKQDESICKLFFFMLILSTLMYFFNLLSHAGSISSISKSAVYENRSGSNLILIVSYLWTASSPVMFLYMIKRKMKYSIVCAACILIVSVVTFTRTYLVVLFIVITLYYLYNGKIRFRKILILGCIVCIGIYSMYLLRGFRYFYSFSDLGTISFFDIHNKSMWLLNQKSGDIYLSDYFYKLVNIQNNYPGLGTGAGYIRLLLLPIPSSLSFGLKPQDICITLGELFGSGIVSSVNFTVTPTLFGDCYANFGFYGFIMGGVWAIIVSLLDCVGYRKSNAIKGLSIVLISSAYINIGRGTIYNAMAGIFYSLIIYGIAIILTKSSLRIRFKFNAKQGR